MTINTTVYKPSKRFQTIFNYVQKLVAQSTTDEIKLFRDDYEFLLSQAVTRDHKPIEEIYLAGKKIKSLQY